ncbi:unnamed protein product [Clonostachys byssicola]|uniref:Amino-acid acetyltransferase, mitochondrial n=1 Tax=Clonostachys byssicola TaxID=160290 RepID=A0A9N9XXC5_9HYPO|nr:unnamed protein product [Clonostachys byssicola]
MISARAWRGTASCGHSWPPNQVGLFSKPNCRTFSYLKRDSNRARATARYFTPTSAARWFSSSTPGPGNKRSLDLDTIVSVLEVSATKRDAKGYLQKYTSKENTSLTKVPQFRHEEPQDGPNEPVSSDSHLPNIAIVKLCDPQLLDGDALLGVAKTLFQLRVLGLLSVVVIDCGIENSRELFRDQAFRLCSAIDSFSKHGSKSIENIAIGQQPISSGNQSTLSPEMRIDDQGRLGLTLNHGLIPVIPSLACPDEISAQHPADSNQLIITLTKYLSGLQLPVSGSTETHSPSKELLRSRQLASVERIIILDPLGGTPVAGRPGDSHRFINLEQEYDDLMGQLVGPKGSPEANNGYVNASATGHASNLRLVKEALSILPSSSSAILTTPIAAGRGNSRHPNASVRSGVAEAPKEFGFDGMVKTRKRRNPILHNLLTDKPVFSSSLPVQRVSHSAENDVENSRFSLAATLVKRGMPVTIFPNPRASPWESPRPGEPRLRLTDTSIDLPRLIYLIEDSFGRALDAPHYLDRVKDNLAGIIIAGEYEGGAILTWETPEGLDDKEAYSQGRLVPYLDKFAVLRSRQGSGGVADVVFSAMVNDCFPKGVCWRSRKNNPVNKWYFERSTGTSKLSDSNWTMFWTTLGLDGGSVTLRDYESVCRRVEPSWADNKHILD